MNLYLVTHISQASRIGSYTYKEHVIAESFNAVSSNVESIQKIKLIQTNILIINETEAQPTISS